MLLILNDSADIDIKKEILYIYIYIYNNPLTTSHSCSVMMTGGSNYNIVYTVMI